MEQKKNNACTWQAFEGEDGLLRGMVYAPRGQEGLIRGMTYVPEGSDGLLPGMQYFPQKKKEKTEDKPEMRDWSEANGHAGDQEVSMLQQKTNEMIRPSINVAVNAENKEKSEGTMRGLRKGMITVDQDFITRPSRDQRTIHHAFGNGNFGLLLIGIEHHVYDTTEGEESEKFYNFQISTVYQVFSACVKYSEVEDQEWVKRYSQGEAYVFPEKDAKKDFVYYVHEIVDNSAVPESWLYGCTGWRKLRNGKKYYLDGNGAVGYPELPVRCKEKLTILRPEWQGKTADYVRETLGMLDICHDRKNSALLLLFFHVGLLTDLFDSAEFPVRFIVGCIGISNSRKTSLAVLMSQLFNRNKLKPPVSFSSTEGGLEMAISQYADALLLIDDFMPGANAQKQSQLQAKLEMVLRAYGDRVAKRRMTLFCKTTEKSFFPVKGCCLITGEMIAGVFSSMSRILVLSQKSESVNLEILSYYQDRPWLLSMYAYDFLKFVTDNYEKIVVFIKKQCIEVRNKQIFKVPRLSETYAVFVITVEIMKMYLMETQRFSALEIERLGNLFKDKLLDVMMENEGRLLEQDVVVTILSALRESMTNENGGCVEKRMYTPKSKAILYDEDYVYIKLEKLYTLTKEYTRQFDCAIALTDKRQIVEYLKEAGIIEYRTAPDGHAENARKIVGLPQNHERYLYLRRRSIEERLKEAYL